MLKENLPHLNRSLKQEREYRVLLGLVDYHIKTGKPVGSNTLKEAGFDELSSATIRNYFSQLEKTGYLTQQHTSGGRLPTPLAYRTYAKEWLNSTNTSLSNAPEIDELRSVETREISAFLQRAAETLSALSNCAVFLSAPRFDQDYIVDLKFIPVDHSRSICVILTDFGVIQTEILQVESKLNSFAAKRIESYFRWRLTHLDRPENMSKEEEELASKLYHELMVRYVVRYSQFTDSDLMRTGFARLLSHSYFAEASEIGTSLSLFENSHSLRLIIKECCKLENLKFWIGDDLINYTTNSPNCAIVAVPYYINQNIVGAVGILGPMRIPYRKLFPLIKTFSNNISHALTYNLYKFKVSFRQPETNTLVGQKLIADQSRALLLEDKVTKE